MDVLWRLSEDCLSLLLCQASPDSLLLESIVPIAWMPHAHTLQQCNVWALQETLDEWAKSRVLWINVFTIHRTVITFPEGTDTEQVPSQWVSVWNTTPPKKRTTAFLIYTVSSLRTLDPELAYHRSSVPKQENAQPCSPLSALCGFWKNS